MPRPCRPSRSSGAGAAGAADSDSGRARRPPFPTAPDSEGAWARALRIGDPPVVTRVQQGTVLFDLRTVAEREETSLLDAIRQICHDRKLNPARK